MLLTRAGIAVAALAVPLSARTIAYVLGVIGREISRDEAEGWLTMPPVRAYKGDVAASWEETLISH
jgi:hypothetical protein